MGAVTSEQVEEKDGNTDVHCGWLACGWWCDGGREGEHGLPCRILDLCSRARLWRVAHSVAADHQDGLCNRIHCIPLPGRVHGHEVCILGQVHARGSRHRHVRSACPHAWRALDSSDVSGKECERQRATPVVVWVYAPKKSSSQKKQ